MLFTPITTSLKNNKQVIIRLASSNDASALLNLIKQYLDTSEYIPINSSDFNKTVAEIEAWIEKLNGTDNSIMLVAEYNGQLIGNLDLTGQHRKTLQHTAVLGMGILLEWRNTGLGTALLSSAVEWAKRNNTLEILTLDVYTENIAGIELYRKQGFKEVGIVPNFIKDNDRYYDNMRMWLALR
ncbi:GNAT family N-acetyltransferase [Myroides odoratimimus]|uniref:GNAT family N-acetyltransferase n=1 Tax=Myroides odoratimimus TaxID=76832 RepID=UPI002578D6FA|nr:GNAT family protein [Myroides odoratimimus]MDM1397960.1 GNAT family N-acetyltransferase [Myroides odoratimimus]